MCRPLIWCGAACLTLAATLCAQQSDREIIQQLTERLAASERRIQALEEKLGLTSAAPAGDAVSAASSVTSAPAPQALAASTQAPDMQGHNMEIPGGGPTLNIRGFFDF